MIPTELRLDNIRNKRFALRKLLDQTVYHQSDVSVPSGALTAEKEPALRSKLTIVAAQIAANPDIILLDSYEAESRKKDWVALEKKAVLADGEIIAIDTRSRPGHKILDHHMTHFYDVRNHAGLSVRSQCSQVCLEKALLTNISMHSTPYDSEIRRMLTMMCGLCSVTKYRTVTSKAIVQFFGAKRILDPCAGWGGRMLGTLAAASDSVYLGCEPDPKTVAGLQGILADPAIPLSVRGRASILDQPVETVLAQIQAMEPFDLVLTSPPYFNLELYAGDSATQSTVLYPSWALWTEGWLKPVILGTLACLRQGGTSCWSVKNFTSDKRYLLADVVKAIHKEAGWVLIKTVTMKGSGRPGGQRIVAGKETRGSEEETFCFRHGN